jgi:hypothetical protein
MGSPWQGKGCQGRTGIKQLTWPTTQTMGCSLNIATVGFGHTTPEHTITSLIDARPRSG